MFLGKKGVVEMSLGELVKIVLSLIVLGAMSVFFYTVILSPILNPPEKKDFEKIYEELIALEEGENIPVFLKAKNYKVFLYREGNQEESKCKKQMCLCYEAGAAKDCKILPKEFAECGVRNKVCIESNPGFIEIKEEKQLLLAMDENNKIKMCKSEDSCPIET